MATLRCVVLADGRIQFFIEDGGFEDGKDAINQAIAALQQAGINLGDASDVESHRDKDGNVVITHHAHS